MLIKLITCGGDYDETLKRRRLYAAALLCVGLVGFLCYFLLVPNSGLTEYARGFYLGAASGVTAGALALLIRIQRLLTNPAARKKAKIKETDEREQHITNEAFHFAGIFTVFACIAALFVLAPISRETCLLLVAVILVYFLSFLAASLWLSKKL